MNLKKKFNEKCHPTESRQNSSNTIHHIQDEVVPQCVSSWYKNFTKFTSKIMNIRWYNPIPSNPAFFLFIEKVVVQRLLGRWTFEGISWFVDGIFNWTRRTLSLDELIKDNEITPNKCRCKWQINGLELRTCRILSVHHFEKKLLRWNNIQGSHFHKVHRPFEVARRH